MTRWCVLYSDGTSFSSDDGPPDQAPGWGVVVIPQYDGGWWGHDLTGLLDCLAQPGPNVVVHGRTVSKDEWRRLLDVAHRHPDFPQTEQRTLMHSWDFYCYHGGD